MPQLSFDFGRLVKLIELNYDEKGTIEEMKKLIITSDDLALEKTATEACQSAFEAGNISAASVVINADQEALRDVGQKLVNYPLGLHLNVFEGIYKEDKLGLFGSEGLFMKVLKEKEEENVLQECLTLDGKVALQREFIDQVDEFIKKFGKKPTHLSYHFGIHFVDEFYKIYWHTAEIYQIPFRWAGQYSSVIPGYRKHPDYYLDGLNNRIIGESAVFDEVRVIHEGGIGELGLHLAENEPYKKRQSEIFGVSDVRLHLEELGFSVLGWEEITW